MVTVFTIGYEQASLDVFLLQLARARVEILVDVRDVAVSRRKGFSKTALSQALASAGLEYTHLRGLGDPKVGRLAAREGRLAEFRKIYAAHLKTDRAVADFETLEELVRKRRACLMCYEADPTDCHRSILTTRLANRIDSRTNHLDARRNVELLRAGGSSRKGRAAR